MHGIRPACVGLIAATAVTLGESNYLVSWRPYWPAILIGSVISFLIWKWNLSVPKVILIAAGMGLLIVC